MTRTLGFGILLAVATACTSRPSTVRSLGDGLETASLPADMREPYDLFAQRCSKCHSLSRALDNGHVEDRFWERYVERMRHQPGSGIAPAEVPVILKFLHYYSSQVSTGTSADAGGNTR